MKKTLLICAMAACVTACVEAHDEYVTGYEYVPVSNTCGCSTCAQPVAPAPCMQTVSTCSTCTQQVQPVFQPVIQPVLQPQPRQVVVVMPPAPAPQPVVEHEIIYKPQPSCGCSKCGCNHK